MSAQELTVWSMALGAIAVFGLARLAQFAAAPSRPKLQAVAYHATVFLLVLILSGVATHTGPAVEGKALRVAQVLAGPLCVGLSDLWIGGWLYAPRRDRLMAGALRSLAVLLPLSGLACLLLDAPYQLPAAAGLSLLGGGMTLWLTARAWHLGDALAPLMAIGCALTLPAIAGLYAITMGGGDLGLGLNAVFASCAALSNAVTGIGLWRRDREEQRARRQPEITSVIDPVTQVRSARSFVRRLVRAQRRRNRSGRDGAVLAVLLFDLERLRTHIGTTGLHEIYIALASRIQRQVGSVNVVGRYYEGCFVALVESIPSVPSLRTLGLRLARSLRQPVTVTIRSGDRTQLIPDIGVGVVHLSRPAAAVDDILDDAQRMATAARSMRWRAAIRDLHSGRAVPIEEAHLGARGRRQQPALRPAG